MPSAAAPGLLDISRTESIRGLRRRLDDCGYSHEGVTSRLGPIGSTALRSGVPPRLMHLTREGRPFDTLVRLFLFGLPVESEYARAALAPVALSETVELGVVRITGSMVEPRITLLPFQHLLLAFDTGGQMAAGAHPDLVMGPSGSSVSLLNCTVRRPCAATLDLGTGCGVQAFFAASHSERVCAVDCNRRAVNFAAFNSTLNGFGNIEFGAGDSFDPVHGQQFDLIVANLPFAISPSKRYSYRDSGMRLDGYAERIAREAPGRLNRDGVFQTICQWVHLGGEPWEDRLAKWFSGGGCDVLVLKTRTQDPLAYAEEWIKEGDAGDAGEAQTLLAEWAAYFEREGVEAVSTGLVTMRRRDSGAGRVSIEDHPGEHGEPYGDALWTILRLRDFVAAIADDDLLGLALAPGTGVGLRQQFEAPQGKWQGAAAEIIRTSGLRYQGRVDKRVGALVLRCDGRRTLRELIGQLAADSGEDPMRLAPAVLGVIRQLIARGYLEPGELSTPGSAGD